MRKYSPAELESALMSLNWSGHFELPEQDVAWLAVELASYLSGKPDKCSACGNPHEVIVESKMGKVCEKCIKDALRDAREMREAQE